MEHRDVVVVFAINIAMLHIMVRTASNDDRLERSEKHVTQQLFGAG